MAGRELTLLLDQKKHFIVLFVLGPYLFECDAQKIESFYFAWRAFVRPLLSWTFAHGKLQPPLDICHVVGRKQPSYCDNQTSASPARTPVCLHTPDFLWAPEVQTLARKSEVLEREPYWWQVFFCLHLAGREI